MKFSDRVRLIAQAFGAKQARERSNLYPTWYSGQPQYAETNFENFVRLGLRKNELIFSCIEILSNTSSQIRMIVTDEEGEELSDHPLSKLLQRPNPFMSQTDMWKAVIIYQMLAGKAIFEKQRTVGGEVIALYPLRPDWVRPVPGKLEMIAYYSYEVPGERPVTIQTEDILEFSLFDPINHFNPWPPIAVASRVGCGVGL